MRFCMPLDVSEGLYVFFNLIRALNKLLKIVKFRESFRRANLTALWIAKAFAKNIELGEVILYMKMPLIFPLLWMHEYIF